MDMESHIKQPDNWCPYCNKGYYVICDRVDNTYVYYCTNCKVTRNT